MIKTTLYAVRAWVDHRFARVYVNSFEAEEGDKTFKVLSPAPMFVGKRPGKDKLMQVDPFMLNSVELVNFCTICRAGQVEEAKAAVIAAATVEIAWMFTRVSDLVKNAASWEVLDGSAKDDETPAPACP